LVLRVVSLLQCLHLRIYNMRSIIRRRVTGPRRAKR
jgi:hypothetical protein